MIYVFYIAVIVIANIITSLVAPFVIFGFIIPAGSFLIGLTFLLRDYVQTRAGRKKTYLLITTALLINVLVSLFFDSMLWVIFASALSFIVSETADTELFTRLNTSFKNRVLLSGVIGGALDSLIFVVIGISPLGVGFIPWVEVPAAILGQYLIKLLMQMLVFGMPARSR
jgi:queuosine precursor transporter